MNLISGSTQGSNEDEERLQKNMSERELTRMQTRTGLAFTPESLDHADTRASFTFNMDLCISQRETITKCPNLHSLEPSTEEGDSHISWQLNLTMASCTFEFNRNSYSAMSPQKDCQEIGNLAESRVNTDGKEFEIGVSSNRNVANEDINLAPPKESSEIEASFGGARLIASLATLRFKDTPVSYFLPSALTLDSARLPIS